MATESFKYLSEARLAQLLRDVSENRERYRSGDFIDLAKENGWGIESSLMKINSAALSDLDGTSQTAEADAKNSLIVYQALQGMTPALAMEECVWTRLTHTECIEYTRARWFSKSSSYDNEKFDKHVLLHFFARGLTGARDDNAIARLWWNMHIATMLSPSSPKDALDCILKTADIRSNLVERSWTGARVPLSRAIVEKMKKEAWLTANEDNFRRFMKILNRVGGGILLEAFPNEKREDAVNKIMEYCLLKAKET
ncbi:hypothetical protein C8E02_3360 [Vogesella indigofera]|uniref:Uncharacterized protein n=1 Tax=Vogesella indigofera TaxID=45465 RepID=A0A495AW00_VOGIN|nr:DUF6339 family protein [Vogesella indigofera]RKQ52891.1 hypothetical protein C8E02_3360 [Vogesella indigofera]